MLNDAIMNTNPNMHMDMKTIILTARGLKANTIPRSPEEKDDKTH